MKIKYLLLAAIAGAIVTGDQLVKMYVHTHFSLHQEIQVIPGFFNLTYVRNTGAAFGIFSESHETFREIFFLSMPPIALLVILALLRTFQESERASIVALSLVFGGAVGNYIDRLRFRYVIDFLDFHLGDLYHWPSFNVADIAIVCGVGILMFLEWLKYRESAANRPSDKLGTSRRAT